jgi:uncharacterized protein YnzC (UPF0291/DUF896 family)
MTRDKNGRFTDCGNPNGRPKTPKYTPPDVIAHRVERNDFFEVDNAPVTITENGKPKQISLRKAIFQQLGRKAALGETRAATEWNKMRNRYVSEYVDEQMAMLKQIMKSEKIVQDHPQDVTDRYLEALQNLKMMLGPGYAY